MGGRAAAAACQEVLTARRGICTRISMFSAAAVTYFFPQPVWCAGLQFNTRFSFTCLQRLHCLQSDGRFVTYVYTVRDFFDLFNGLLDCFADEFV